MKNIDLHCHPSQKTMLTRNTEPGENIDFNTKILVFTDEMIGDILDSQSSLKQLQKGEFKLVFWSIYTMEREVISLSRLEEAIRREEDQDLVDVELLERVKTAKINYTDYMMLEWDIMKEEVANNPDLHLIHDISEMVSDKLNVFPSLEGSHAFITSVDTENYIDNGLISRFTKFLQTQPLSFITLTHFTDKQLFTHCFALKLATKKELSHSKFYPKYLRDKGFSLTGEKIIDTLIEMNKAMDIKHTSLVGRLSIYDKIKNQAPGYSLLMSSHAGIAGISYKEFLTECLIPARKNTSARKSRIFDNRNGYIVKLMYKRRKGPLNLSFNPQTLNLYDEDIRSILSIGGLIGFSLDQRILGASTAIDRVGHILNYHSDYLTLEEFLILCTKAEINPEDYLGENYMDHLDEELIDIEEVIEGTEEFVTPGEKALLDPKPIHRRRVAQTIMHILNIGLEVTNTPWDHIALGSDYDGLIDAVNCCKTSADVPKFKKDLVKLFEKLERKGDYAYSITPEELVRKIFEENIIEFYRRGALVV